MRESLSRLATRQRERTNSIVIHLWSLKRTDRPDNYGGAEIAEFVDKKIDIGTHWNGGSSRQVTQRDPMGVERWLSNRIDERRHSGVTDATVSHINSSGTKVLRLLFMKP